MSTQPGSPERGWIDNLYRLSRGKTIALIVVTIAALAGAGALAGAVMGDAPPLEAPVPNDEGGYPSETEPATELLDLNALRQPDDGMEPVAAFMQELTPSPVPTETTAPAPTPAPTSSPGPTPSGGSHVLAGGVATIPLPVPWEVSGTNPDGSQAAFSDGRGNWVFAGVYNLGATADASTVLTQNIQGLLPPENYTQLQVTQPAPVQPIGSMTSFALMRFRAVWSDPQGSFALEGDLWAATRADGNVLIMRFDHTPPETFQDAVAQFSELWAGGFNSFAGTQ